MNNNILVKGNPQVTVTTDSLLSTATKKFFHNKQISVCKNKQHKQDFFGVSSLTAAETYLGNSIKGRHICKDCSYTMESNQAKHVRKNIMRIEATNNLPCLQQEKLLAYGNEILNKANIFSGGSWGCVTIEDAAIKLLENPRNNLEPTHPGYQAAKYLYSQAHQHKVEYLMQHGVISLSSIDDHITNLKNSLHCIAENDDAKINSEGAITANDFLNQNQEIKYLLGKLYIFKAILEIKDKSTAENTLTNKLDGLLHCVGEAYKQINAEFIYVARNYFYMFNEGKDEITANLRKNAEVRHLKRFKLKIQQLEVIIDKALKDSKNIKKHEYKNIEKQYLENNYAYFFTLLIIIKLSTDKNDLLNNCHNLYRRSKVKDQFFSKLQEYTQEQYKSLSKSTDSDEPISDDSSSSSSEISSDDELCSSN